MWNPEIVESERQIIGACLLLDIQIASGTGIP
jgi:hypothetical protein